MLESIEIRNFKRIQGNDKPLILKNLTNVNYLVGENGSGKSSILERLYINKLLKYKKNEILDSIFKKICGETFDIIKESIFYKKNRSIFKTGKNSTKKITYLKNSINFIAANLHSYSKYDFHSKLNETEINDFIKYNLVIYPLIDLKINSYNIF